VKVVPTETETRVQVPVHHPIAANVVTVHAIHVRHPIVRHVRAKAVLMETATRVQAKAALMETAIRVHLPIVPAEVILMVAIVQKLVMIVGIARLRVLANAVVVQIAPVVGLLMTVKSVHVVA
jgi:hypothetical protein